MTVAPQTIPTSAYQGSFGKSFDQSNPYTYAMGPEQGNPRSVNTQITRPGARTTPLIPTIDPLALSQKSYDQLSPEQKFYLGKKWGLWQNKEEDEGVKGIADTLGDINRIITYKGGQAVQNYGQVGQALAPLIKKRNKKGGLGKILGAVAPIALSFALPGIGTALGAALGTSATVGTALAGAGLGAGTSALTGGNPLTGAVLGGIGGAFTGAGGLSGISKSLAGKVGSPLYGTSAGKFLQGASRLSSSLGGSGGGGLSSLSKVTDLLGALTPQQRSQITPEQMQQIYAMQMQQQQGGMRRNSPLGRWGMGFARGGLVSGVGDGMSDNVPALLEGQAPVLLSDSEHITPALQVSLLGRGSSTAGSQRLEEIINREIKKMYGSNIDARKMQDKAMR
jgi:hypothetical protein